MGKLGTPAVAPLSEVLRDPNAEVRATAAWAFGGMEQPVVAKAVPVLIEAMRREDEKDDEEIRFGAAHMLRQLDPKAAEKIENR